MRGLCERAIAAIGVSNGRSAGRLSALRCARWSLQRVHRRAESTQVGMRRGGGDQRAQPVTTLLRCCSALPPRLTVRRLSIGRHRITAPPPPLPMSHAELFAPLGVGLQFDVTLPCPPPIDGVEFDDAGAAAAATGDQADGDAADARASKDAAAAAAASDLLSSSLPAPVLSFAIQPSTAQGASSITAALAEASAELLLGPEERRTIHQAALAVLESSILEQLQRKYSQVLLRELQQPHAGTGTSESIAQQLKPRRQDSSDSIGHWDTEEEDSEQTKQDGQPAVAAPLQQHARPAAGGALAAWKQARFASTGTVSAASASNSRRRTSSDARLAASSSSVTTTAAAAPQPALGALLSTLLAAAAVPSSSAAAGSPSSAAAPPPSASQNYLLTADSPLSKLYQLSSLYHTEHLVYLAKKQASYTALGAEQSREMDIICQQAQQSEIEGAAMHGMESAAPEHASAAAAASASALAPPQSLLSRSSSSSSTTSNSGSSSSATALSEAISMLVQSHLSQSAFLEDLWESRLDAWCTAQRRKFRVYARDTLEEFLDRAGREREAHAEHKQVQARLALQADRKKSAKILMTEQEEAEEAERQAARERAARGPHPLELMQRVFPADARGAREMDALLATKLNSLMINPAWQPQPAVVDEKAVTAARALALSAAAKDSASSSMPSPLSIAAAPPAPVAPFPMASILAAKSVYLGPASRAPTRPLQLFLTNDPLFVPNSQRGTANPTAASAASSGSVTAASASASATASLPVSSSPLISLPHFVSALDALYGPRGSGGLAAMVLPHHSSPLSHAAYSMPNSDAEESAGHAAEDDASAALDLDSININSLPTSLPSDSSSRRAREKALNAFSAANLYVKNLLQYCRAQNDLICEDLAQQIGRVEKELLRMKTQEIAATSASRSALLPQQAGTLDDDLLGDRASGPLVLTPAAAPAPPSIDSLLSHGDTLLTKHSHLLNAQLCFHVNVHPRRGGVAGAAAAAALLSATTAATGGAHGVDHSPLASNGSVSGVVMNEAELKQQVRNSIHIRPTPLGVLPSFCGRTAHSCGLCCAAPLCQSTLFSVLSHLVSLSCSHNVSVLSLPLIWDNILLSMWTTSGNYVGFGWKDADAYAAGQGAAGSSGGGGGGIGGALGVSSLESNRQEELEVYQCMVRYLESHCRTLKQVLGSLPADAPLRSVVFYLPSQMTSAGGGGAGAGAGAGQGHALDLDASGTHGAALLADLSDSAGADDVGAALSTPSAGAHASVGQHPFLAKCKAIFAEVFQSS